MMPHDRIRARAERDARLVDASLGVLAMLRGVDLDEVQAEHRERAAASPLHPVEVARRMLDEWTAHPDAGA